MEYAKFNDVTVSKEENKYNKYLKFVVSYRVGKSPNISKEHFRSKKEAEQKAEFLRNHEYSAFNGYRKLN